MYLWFGDSNTKCLFDGDIDKYPGLMLNDPLFYFYLECHDLSQYKNIICFIGTNDQGRGYTMKELTKCYSFLKNYCPKIIIVGPYSPDVDTIDMPTTDGIHLSESSYLEIGYKIKIIENIN